MIKRVFGSCNSCLKSEGDYNCEQEYFGLKKLVYNLYLNYNNVLNYQMYYGTGTLKNGYLLIKHRIFISSIYGQIHLNLFKLKCFII